MIPLLAAVLGMTLHEWAHARCALACGDATAFHLGRVSLNPLRHADPVWSVAVPLLTWYALGIPVGAGRPVPVNVRGRDRVLVHLAGPAANLWLAGVCALGAMAWPPLWRAVWVNLVLAGLNLLGPDGWHVVRGIKEARRVPAR